MNGRVLKATVLMALFLLSTSVSMVNTGSLHESTGIATTQANAVGVVDVPSYRVNDKWVYETQFDVAQLLAQANVSASLNTLTGDTTNTITDIVYTTDSDGSTVLAYEMDIDGSFTSGNSGATLEGVSGRLNIDYTGTDTIRARDLALLNSEFTLDVEFLPFNLGFLRQNLGVVTFDNTYEPAKERHDFPLRNGDQWYMPFNATTEVTGSSDYFDPSDFDQDVEENNSWQVVKNQAPQEGQTTPQYTGCANSYKISEWNATGVNLGFNWYCPAVRGPVWTQVTNPAGFTIDWLLKTYTPADSNSVTPSSSPGGRNTLLDVYTAYSATLPDSVEQISIEYAIAGFPSIPVKNTNLQLRYEIAGTIHNPTTDNSGTAQVALNVSDEVDDTPSSDDHTSNGVVVYDPVNKIVGVTTVVQDLSVVGVDLIAQSSSVIVERTRDGVTSTLGASIGYNALPGDTLHFSLPAQNRGVLSAPSTSMEVTTPDNVTFRRSLPSIAPYAEERTEVEWTVPTDMAIGTASLRFTVDPDNNVTADANLSNNDAFVDVFIGRAPVGNLTGDAGKYTFENVTLNASASLDPDGGTVDCRFEIESRFGLIEVIEAPDCVTHWNWSNSGSWNVRVLVIDQELDTDSVEMDIEILNRPPSFNLSHPAEVAVEASITIEAVDITDIDTTSPPGQQVSISWPGLDCAEGLTQPTCTFIPMLEGPMAITAVATDDDGAQTTKTSEVVVLNVPPTLSAPELWKGGEQMMPDANGSWHLNEDEVALLRATATDSTNDQGTLIVQWHPSLATPEWNITSIGVSSSEPVSWTTAGQHIINVRALDADGASSQVMEAFVTIHNVAPTVTGLPGNTVEYEDGAVNLNVTATDTPSDMANLVVCWDFDANIDLDEDGVGDNDCEQNGTSASPSWPTRGLRMITVTVTDDDGATAQQQMNVSVLNYAPTAVITPPETVEGLTEGDNITLSGLASASLETESDRASLAYQWDSSHLDTDLDGSKVGDVDFSGPVWTIDNLPAGTWTVVLTVTDDDGESRQSEFTFFVANAPPEGVVDRLTSAVGTTGALVIGLLGIIIVALLAFLALTRRPAPLDEYSMFVQQNDAFTAPPQVAPPAEAVKIDAFAIPQSMPNMEAPAPAPTLAPPAAGPPLPTTGLPQGWTMEQWHHYGDQWLAANQPVAAPVEPIRSQPPPTPASAELQSLLDDLDF